MRLAVIPGDGIGPEVMDEALKVLDEVAPDVSTTTYDLGAARWHATGELLPESVLTEHGVRSISHSPPRTTHSARTSWWSTDCGIPEPSAAMPAAPRTTTTSRRTAT